MQGVPPNEWYRLPHTQRQKTIRTQGGDCKSRDIVYAAQCTLCPRNNTYVGKTSNTLAKRINGHRSSFNSIIKSTTPIDPNAIDDSTILGAHLFFKHLMKDKADFDKYYRFSVISQSDPSTLRKSEHYFIKTLQTVKPLGLNQIDSIRTSIRS